MQENDEIDGLITEVEGYYKYLKSVAIDLPPDEALTELNYCNVTLARVSEIYAVATAICTRAQARFLHDYTEKTDVSMRKTLMEAATETEGKLLFHVERLSATLDKRIKSLISVLSFGKEQMRSNGGQR